MLGDQTLFVRHDDMSVAWSLITRYWMPGLRTKAAGVPACSIPIPRFLGASASDTLLERAGYQWLTSGRYAQ